MRNFLINGSIAVFAFVLCLVLAEYFLRLNAAHHWIATTDSGLASEEPLAGDDFPEEVVAATKKAYPKPPFDSDTFDKIEERKSEKKIIRRNGYIFPGRLIKMGLELTAEKVIHELHVIGDTELINTKYTIDVNRVRKSSSRAYEGAKKNILLLGCSFAFGQGVSDHQTISAYLAREFKSSNVYNLGVPAGGLTGILDDIHHSDRIRSISKTGGVAVYIFFADHFRRHFSLKENFMMGISPRVKDYAIKDGKLVATNKVFALNLVKHQLLKWMDKTELGKLVDGGRYNSKSNQDEFLDFLVYIRDFYKNEYNLNFYLYIISPGDVPSTYFYNQLAARGIKLMLYKHENAAFPRNFLAIPADGHATPMGNEFRGRLIAHRLRQDGF